MYWSYLAHGHSILHRTYQISYHLFGRLCWLVWSLAFYFSKLDALCQIAIRYHGQKWNDPTSHPMNLNGTYKDAEDVRNLLGTVYLHIRRLL